MHSLGLKTRKYETGHTEMVPLVLFPTRLVSFLPVQEAKFPTLMCVLPECL